MNSSPSPVNKLHLATRELLLSRLPLRPYWLLWKARNMRRVRRVQSLTGRDPWRDALLTPSVSYVSSILRSDPPTGWRPEFTDNPSFTAGDAEVYFAQVRRSRPCMIIEVGVGYSSHIARHALDSIGGGRLVLIDPDPRCPVPVGAELLRQPIEEVPIELFMALDSNDVLFIDSSHTREEAEYHWRHVIPRLRSGVLIHIHDVMYPYEPRADEESVVWRAIRQQPSVYSLIGGLAFAWSTGQVQRLVHRPDRARVPSSLWLRKV